MTGIGFLVREDSEGCLDSAFYYMTKGGFNIYNQKHEDTIKGHFFLTLHDIIEGE